MTTKTVWKGLLIILLVVLAGCVYYPTGGYVQRGGKICDQSGWYCQEYAAPTPMYGSQYSMYGLQYDYAPHYFLYGDGNRAHDDDGDGRR